MLMYSYLNADDTIEEGPSVAETGGFVIYLPVHHKIFANAGGMYIEIETAADPSYDSTGLSRVHHPYIDPLVGPTAAVPNGEFPLNIGISWAIKGKRQTLAQVQRGQVEVTLHTIQSKADNVQFSVDYKLDTKLYSIPSVNEAYIVQPNATTVTASVPVDVDELTIIFPVFRYDGKTNSTVTVESANNGGPATVTVELLRGGGKQVFIVPKGAVGVSYDASKLYPQRNGYISYAEVHLAKGSRFATYIIAPSAK